LNFVTIKADIDNIEHQELEFDKFVIAEIPPKTIKKFHDPFKYDPTKDPDAEEQQ